MRQIKQMCDVGGLVMKSTTRQGQSKSGDVYAALKGGHAAGAYSIENILINAGLALIFCNVCIRFRCVHDHRSLVDSLQL